MIYEQTVSEELINIIKTVSRVKAFQDFRLCGGTALSLQVGHRLSVDADFITEKDFDKDEIVKTLMEVFPNVKDIYQGTFGVFAKVNGIKVDFLSWKIPFIRPAISTEIAPLLNIEEIAAMKLFAITQRGEKKDYIDIGELLKSYSLPQLLSFYRERHKNSDPSLIVSFLVSFSDIDGQAEPTMLNGLKWQDYKGALEQAVKAYLQQ